MLPKYHTPPSCSTKQIFFTHTRHPIFQLAVLRGDSSLPSTPLQRTTLLLAQLVSKQCHRRTLSPNPRQSRTFRERGKRMETEDKSQQGSERWGTRLGYVRMSTNSATKRKRVLQPRRLPSFITEWKGTHWINLANCQHMKGRTEGCS